VRALIGRYPGQTDVVLIVDSWSESAGREQVDAAEKVPEADRLRYVLTTGNDCRVSVGPEFLQGLGEIVGESNYALKAARSRRGSGQSVGR